MLPQNIVKKVLGRVTVRAEPHRWSRETTPAFSSGAESLNSVLLVTCEVSGGHHFLWAAVSQSSVAQGPSSLQHLIEKRPVQYPK